MPVLDWRAASRDSPIFVDVRLFVQPTPRALRCPPVSRAVRTEAVSATSRGRGALLPSGSAQLSADFRPADPARGPTFGGTVGLWSRRDHQRAGSGREAAGSRLGGQVGGDHWAIASPTRGRTNERGGRRAHRRGAGRAEAFGHPVHPHLRAGRDHRLEAASGALLGGQRVAQAAGAAGLLLGSPRFRARFWS
jgi:hypothetical protein